MAVMAGASSDSITPLHCMLACLVIATAGRHSTRPLERWHPNTAPPQQTAPGTLAPDYCSATANGPWNAGTRLLLRHSKRPLERWHRHGKRPLERWNLITAPPQQTAPGTLAPDYCSATAHGPWNTGTRLLLNLLAVMYCTHHTALHSLRQLENNKAWICKSERKNTQGSTKFVCTLSIDRVKCVCEVCVCVEKLWFKMCN